MRKGQKATTIVFHVEATRNKRMTQTGSRKEIEKSVNAIHLVHTSYT
jgi:hypothetical protein